ncbi:MAG: Arginine deiminase, partial [Streblomastix strix]
MLQISHSEYIAAKWRLALGDFRPTQELRTQKSIQYKLDNEIKANELREEDNLMLQSNFKEAALNKLTEEQLVDVILSQPTVIIQKRKGDEEEIESSTAKMKPFTNMTLCKDQQITTRKGVVIGSMQKRQRNRIAGKGICLKEIVCTYEETARLLVIEEKFKGQIYLIPFDEIIAMNG